MYFAIRDAVSAAREERGFGVDFRLDVPATYERIRMACADSCTQAATSVSENGGRDGNVGAGGVGSGSGSRTDVTFQAKGSC